MYLSETPIMKILMAIIVLGSILTVVLTINYYSIILNEKDRQIRYLESKVNSLEEDNDRLLKLISELNNVIDELNTTLNEKEENLSKLVTRVSELENRINSVLIENNRLKINISTLMTQNKVLRDEVSRLRSIINLEKKAMLNNTYDLRIGAHGTTTICSFNAEYPGYLLINITVLQGSVYIEVSGTYAGEKYIYRYPLTTTLTRGDRETIIIPILPGEITIKIVNMGSEEAVINLLIKYVY